MCACMTTTGKTGGSAVSRFGGTDSGRASVGAEASEAQCLAHNSRLTGACCISGQVVAMEASMADVLIAMAEPIMPDGIVHA